MAAKPFRWGILGAGRISSDFVNAVQLLGPSHTIEAVAARSESSAKQFAEKFNIARYYGNYDALGKDQNIDCVYVGSITSTHFTVCMAMINAGKSILCEKALCCNLRDVNELLSHAKEKNVFLMEAMWARCNPVYRELNKRLLNEEIGDITHAHVSFGLPMADMETFRYKKFGGGCMLDLGIYVLNFILLVMGDVMPLEMKTMGSLNDDGVEIEVSSVLKFSNNKFATFNVSITSTLPNEAVVTGTKGTIKLCGLFCTSTHLTGPSGDFDCAEEGHKVGNFPNSYLLKYEAEEVARCIKEGVKESSLVPHSLSLMFSQLIEQIRRDVGVDFE